MSTYWLIISVTGSLLLFFLSMGSFFGMEALRLKHDHRISAGFKLLLCSIVFFCLKKIYGLYAGYIIYKIVDEKGSHSGSHMLVEESDNTGELPLIENRKT